MKINDILESEKDSLLDYLHGYCDNPLARADSRLVTVFTKWGYDTITDADRIREILSDNVKAAYFCGTVPPAIDFSIWLDVAEIETDLNVIEPEEIDGYTINEEAHLAYIYVGYGFMVEYNINGIIASLEFYEGINHE